MGSNVVRISNESYSVAGTVGKINNEMVLFRSVFNRSLEEGSKLASDFYVDNGVLGGTYFEAIQTSDQRLQIFATKSDKTQLDCRNLTFEAGEVIVAADLKANLSSNYA